MVPKFQTARYLILRSFGRKRPHGPLATPRAPFLWLRVALGDAQGRRHFKPRSIWPPWSTNSYFSVIFALVQLTWFWTETPAQPPGRL